VVIVIGEVVGLRNYLQNTSMVVGDNRQYPLQIKQFWLHAQLGNRVNLAIAYSKQEQALSKCQRWKLAPFQLGSSGSGDHASIRFQLVNSHFHQWRGLLLSDWEYMVRMLVP
jgi:hypothetical protein